MKKTREYGLILNFKKCSIKTNEITFFGMRYGREGVKPDTEKTIEIEQLPTYSKVALRCTKFLGYDTVLVSFHPQAERQDEGAA